MSRGRAEKDSEEGRQGLVEALDVEMRRLMAEVVLFNQAVADRVGSNPTDLQCLNVLLEEGSIGAGRLAELTGLTTGAVTGVLDRLERAGYAWRERDPEDKRRVIVHPLPERVGQDIRPAYESMGRAFLQLCSRYDAEELAVVLDFVRRSHPMNREETAKLRGPSPHAKQSSDDSFRAVPLGPATSGRLVFERGAAGVRLTSGAAEEELFRARFEHPTSKVEVDGNTVTIRQRRRRARRPGLDESTGEVALSGSIPWVLEVRGGAAGLDADLGSLTLRSFDLTGGASRVSLVLPRPSGTVPVRVLGGAHRLDVALPQGVPARVKVSGGANGLSLDGQRLGAVAGETLLESPGYGEATDRYEFEASGGAKDLTVFRVEER